jgi:Ca2+-binding RTX toxin-like protein
MLMCACPDCLATRQGEKGFVADDGGHAVVASAGSGSFAAGAAQAPSYAVNAVVNPYGWQWGSFTPGTAAVVTYSFLTSVPNYYGSGAGERNQFVPMNAVQQQAARDALTLFAEAANITFVQAAAGTGSINFGTANLGNGIGGWAYYPAAGYVGVNNASAAGDVWITNRYAGYANPVKGSWEYLTFIHEVGHAIGLKHPGNYNAGGGGTGGPYLPAAEDSNQYTVMSYYSGPSYGNYEPITPQLYDIAAVQYLYGTNTSTRSGDSTYTFATTTEIRTIWDGGGNDTFDASSQTAGVKIDLRPGSFSSIAGTNNVAIAYGAAIEIAIGSNYADTLVANDAGNTLRGMAGNDTLTGGAGSDRLSGGTGADTLTGKGGADIFAFTAGESVVASGGRDRITDFTHGVDLIDLAGIDANSSTPGIVDAFRFLVSSAFDGFSAALTYFYDAARSVTVVHGDVNGDFSADFAIDLTGNITLTRDDFTSQSLAPLVPLNLSGTSGADTLNGGELNDTLSGLDGSDTLRGFGGGDVLDGGAGADSMIGGTGSDIYVVDNVNDQVIENSGSAYTAPSGFMIKGAADLDGDNELDVLLVNTATNATQLQLIKNGIGQTPVALPSWAGWPAQGLADLDGDGDKDVLYQSGSTLYAVYLNGTSQTGQGYVTGKTPDAVAALSGANEGTDTVQASVSYTLAGGVENLTLTGSANIDGTGNAADNTLVGNSGNNVLTGKAGADILTGAGGADTFAFGTGDSPAASGQRDLIMDFVQGVDRIDISGMGSFRFLGTAAFDGQSMALRATFDSSRGVTVLAGDTNGDGSADVAIDIMGNVALSQGDFAAGSLLVPVTATGTASADTLNGGELNDTLSGLDGSDTLRGFGGDDVLDGGAGADSMIGGKGNDTYVVDDVNDQVTENNGSAYTAPSGFTIKGTADLDGDNELDVLLVNTATNATQLQLIKNGIGQAPVALPSWAGWSAQGLADLDGDGDKDVLYQSGGTLYAVYLNGISQTGQGYVTGRTPDAVAALSGGNEGSDTVQASVSYTLAGGIENLTLTGSANIGGTGTAADNVITGNSGTNTITGGAGNDTLDGGAGADILLGGAGNDIYIVDDVGDLVVETSGPAYTTPAGFAVKGTADLDGDGELDVLLVNTVTNAPQLQLVKNGVGQAPVALPNWVGWPAQGLADLDGDGDKDVLYQSGSTLYAVYLNGTTQTGQGYVTGKVPDAISPMAGANQGVDLVRSSVSATLTSGVENLILTGSANIDGTGNAADNTIVGNSGNNILSGAGGADSLTGGAGSDTFRFNGPSQGTATVTDFLNGADVLEFLAAEYGHGLVAGGTASVVNASDTALASNVAGNGYFIFDNAGANVGTLSWDATGGSGADAIAIGVIQNVTSLLSSDFHLI